MLKVELIYDKDCPNVQEAREQLLRAFHETGIPSKWQEWNRGAIETPTYVHSYGSPTILVNGQDVAGLLPSDEGNCCRLYTGKDGGLQGVPPVEVICTALLKSNEIPRINSEVKDQRRSWQTAFTALPTFGAVMLPNLTCSACWPAYAALLGTFGLSFLNYTPYLFPLTILFLILTVSSIGHSAKRRYGYAPLCLAILASLLVIVGRFILTSNLVLYCGIGIFLAASVWNSWPVRKKHHVICSACAPEEVSEEKAG